MNLPDVDTYPWDQDVRDDEMVADAIVDACAYCTGPLVILGQLGTRLHSRCRNCGAECSRVQSRPTVTDDGIVQPF